MWAVRLFAACGVSHSRKKLLYTKVGIHAMYELALNESAVLVSLLWNLDNISSYQVKNLGFKPELTDSSPPIFVSNQQ